MPRTFLDLLLAQQAPPAPGPSADAAVMAQPPRPRTPWEAFTAALPQPADVFGPPGGFPAPVYRPGWGDLPGAFWQQWTQAPWPERPPGYWDDPAHWPDGRIPYGARF